MADKVKTDELDWVRIREDYSIENTETTWEKLKRKSKENPFIPLGCAATVGALSCGLWNFYKGNSRVQQYMMRARIGAQAFTIMAIVVGFMLMQQKQKST